jgi:glycosyltransferase involved in cell wall biosynthesis
VRRQSYGAVSDILVCANGCRDATADAVRAAAGQDPRITLYELPEAGKPAAWNVLFAAAQTDLVVFIDADVALEPGAIEELVRVYQTQPGLTAVAALTVPVLSERYRLLRLLGPPRDMNSGICGRLYLVSRSRLVSRFRELGLSRMPEELIHEDAWLTGIIGREDYTVIETAQVYYTYPALGELLALFKRSVRSQKQLDRAYAVSGVQYGPPLSEKIRRWVRALAKMPPRAACATLLHLFIRKLFHACAALWVRGEPLLTARTGWTVTKSSKVVPKAYAEL